LIGPIHKLCNGRRGFNVKFPNLYGIRAAPQGGFNLELSLAALGYAVATRITLLAPRRTICFAASLPRPELTPMMMTVFETKEVVGIGI
jgi:hypothetical protein